MEPCPSPEGRWGWPRPDGSCCLLLMGRVFQRGRRTTWTATARVCPAAAGSTRCGDGGLSLLCGLWSPNPLPHGRERGWGWTLQGGGTVGSLPALGASPPRALQWNRRNERGETPLHRACIEGDLRRAQLLLGQVGGGDRHGALWALPHLQPFLGSPVMPWDPPLGWRWRGDGAQLGFLVLLCCWASPPEVGAFQRVKV